MQQTERGIYYETAYAGVTLGALIFPQGTLMIDAPLRAEDARIWRSTLLSLGSSGNRLLINLDSHPDRTLGARAMDCPILAHQKTAQVFRNRPSVFKGQISDSGAEWEASNDMVGTRWATPDITFSHHLTFHWGKSQIKLEHHPGPTPGSIWVIIPTAKIAFVGDTVLHDQPPFLASADLTAWLTSLDLLLAHYRDYLLIGGRSGPVSIEVVRTQQRLLKDILKGMERLAKRSASSNQTEALIEGLLASVTIPSEKREQYIQRLRHGLYQYYNRRYHSTDSAAEQE
jgi:glyoxylase-like metal-dependent hydrolase (beta-lactamase superfamily II)